MTPLLVHIQPFDLATSARIDVRSASALEGEAFGLGGFQWTPSLVQRPQISIETMAPDLSGRAQNGQARLAISLGASGITTSRSIKWGGAALKIYSAKQLAWPGVTEFDGEIVDQSYDPDTDILTITAEVSASLIDRPLLSLEFDGTGGAGGDAQKRGTLKPTGFGACENIEPIWFDATRNIGMIDGYGNCTAITRLMEGASDMGASVGNYANYTALAAAIDAHTIPPGRWGTCVAEGLVGLGAPPTGTIGVNATFGSNRLGAMMSRILTVHAGVAGGQVDSASFTALDTALNMPTRRWFSAQQDCKSLLETMARSGNATLIISLQRKVGVSRAVSSAAVATLDRSGGQLPRCVDWRILSPMKPVWQLKARAARPENVLAFDAVNYVDDIIDRGGYGAAVVYRAGNVVWLADKSSWIYTNPIATAGNAPPTWPTLSNAYWQNLSAPLTATAIGVEPGANVTETHIAAAIAGQSSWATYGTLPPSRLEGLTNGSSITIYRRSLTTPALPNATATITFATGVITGLTNGWTTAVPASDGNPLWISQGPAIGTGTTATIAAASWDAPRALADDKIKTFITGISTIATIALLAGTALASGLTVSRTSVGTRVNAAGVIEQIAANLPRWDYDPVALALKGLLLEEGRTNIRTYSEDFTNAVWQFSNTVTVTANAATAPDGTATADKIAEQSATQEHRLFGYSAGWTTTNGVVYTDSIFIKDAGRGFAQLQLPHYGSGAVNVDLSTGATNTIFAGAITAVSVVAFPNGWWRVAITGTSDGSIGQLLLRTITSISAAVSQSYAGGGTLGFYVWGAQLEAGAFATSYIPSTGATATARAAEYAEMSGASFSNWFTAAQGSLSIECSTFAPSPVGVAAAIYNTGGSNASVIQLGLDPASQANLYAAAGTLVASFDHGTPATGVVQRLALTWANNDFASSLNGSAVLTDNAGTYGTTANKLRLGQTGNGTLPLNGHVSALTFWNTRLVNADLVQLSGAASTPFATAIGDIWISLAEGKKQRRAASIGTGGWYDVQDAAIATAQATADGKNKIFAASASAPLGAIAGDMWPDTSSAPTVVRRFDGVSTWTAVATYGAQAGLNIFRTDGVTPLTQAEIRTIENIAAGISGQGALATLNTVGAPQVNANAITAPYIASVGVVVLSTSSGSYQTITGLSFTATIPTGETLDLDLNLFLLWSGSDGTRFNVDAILLRDGSTVASFGTVMDTNDMATNNQGGFAVPSNLSARVDGNSTSSVYSVQVQLSNSVSESNSGGSKTFSAPLDIRVRQGILRGRRYSR